MSEDTLPQDHNEDDNLTKSYRQRWEYIGTVLAAVMIFSLAAITVCVAAGIFTLSALTQGWFVLYFTVTLMAATWAFGEGALEAVQKIRGKK